MFERIIARLASAPTYIFLTVLNLFFWLPDAFQLTRGQLIDSDLMQFLLDTLPYDPRGRTFFVPFAIAFMFGVYKGKRGYVQAGVSGLIAAAAFGYVSFWDIEHGVQGGWAEYGTWSGFAIIIVLATLVTTSLAFAGGYVRNRFYQWRIRATA